MDSHELRQAIQSRMPQLDALRGIAILWVILHNAALNGVGHPQGVLLEGIFLIGNMGWIGVQLFFVLSGFLITGILLDGRGSDNQFRVFYIRRTLRIFPLYYGFLFVAFAFLPWMGLANWPDSTHSEKLLYWSYLTNWGLPFDLNMVFPHLWSLAIEEQYYLLWPLLVVFLSRRVLTYLCLVLIATAFLGRAYLVWKFDPAFAANAMYTFSFARWDALAIGSLLALVVRSDMAIAYIQRHFALGFYALSLLLLTQVLVLHNFSAEGVPGIFNQTTIAFWSALIILLAIVSWNNSLDRLRPVFSNGFLSWLGKYSYAIYIFHVPAKMIWFEHMAFAVTPNTPWHQFEAIVYNFTGVTLTASIAAYISWRILERPFLELKNRFVLSKS
jgi:peptidoglycan/LPS O-acetylase OafA/YrhL